MMRAVPTEGRGEFYVYYSTDAIYFGLVAYEKTTEGLVASHHTCDSNVWQDDGVEFYIDANMDQRSFWQILSNHIGVILDARQSQEGGNLSGGNEWNGDFELATQVEPTHWSIELALPFAEIDAVGTSLGDVWGFNVIWVRIGHAAEHGQFAPTYGRSLRPGRFGVLIFD